MPGRRPGASDLEAGLPGLWDTPPAAPPPGPTGSPAGSPATPSAPPARRRHDPANDAKGHRKRLRARLLAVGPEALHDYELLESALFLAFAQADTKPLAKALLREFGDLPAVLAASPAELRARTRGLEGVKGLNPETGLGDAAIGAIKTIHAISVRALRRQALRGPVLSSMDIVLDYLHLDKAGLVAEQFRVLFLNTKNRLLRDELLWEGTVNHSPAYPREIVKRALELGASALILVHNHPSGDPTPSRDDVALTRQVVAAAALHDITVHDHLVIGREGHASFRALGLLAA
ncbi:RadC family protein [Thermaurantiacus tibetensis]|uniref:RadC family protein n=1 Tax=Thermaurantiacus tibetensis TaxID=2759035 RepID=UPI002E2D8C75|nr:DNA repair protein RadC [Thermaurantiacus tibetensis]